VALSPNAGYGLLILEVSRYHTHTHCKTPVDERSAVRRDLYLTTHNRQTFMPPTGFEPTIPASQLPQTHALDRASTTIGAKVCASVKTLFLW
jgi:hypothetical protein